MAEYTAANVEETTPESAAEVEDNGPWFWIAMFVIGVLFAVAGVAVVHALVATFS